MMNARKTISVQMHISVIYLSQLTLSIFTEPDSPIDEIAGNSPAAEDTSLPVVPRHHR